MKKIIYFLVVFFIGCSSKEVFEPKHFESTKLKEKSFYKELSAYSKNSLTFKELALKYDKKGNPYWVWVNYDINGKKLGDFIKTSKDIAIYKNKIWLIKNKKIIELPYLVFDVTRKDNLLAIIFNNNYYGIYDIKSKKFLFLNSSDMALSARYLHAKPIFYKDLVLFPLLNGEVAVVDAKTYKYIRSIPVSQNSLNSSILFMQVLKDNLIIVTSNKVLNVTPNFVYAYKDNIKHALMFDKKIVLVTIDGRVVFLNEDLKPLKTLEFSNANFLYPSVCKGKLYLLTNNNYLISINSNYKYKIYKLNNKLYKGIDYLTKLQKCKIYNADEVLNIE